MFNKLSIRTKLIFGFGLASIIVIIIGVSGYNGMESTNKIQNYIVKNSIPSIISLQRINVSKTSIKAQEFGLANTRLSTNSEIEHFIKRIDEEWGRIDTAISNYESLPMGENEKILWNEFQDLWKIWREDNKKVVVLAKMKLDILSKEKNEQNTLELNKIDSELFEAIKTSRSHFKNPEIALEKVIKENIRLIDTKNKDAEISMQLSIKTMILLLVFGVIISILFGLIISVSIKKNILSIINETRLVVNSALEGNLDKRGRLDVINSEFKGIMDGINSIIDAFVIPFTETSQIIKKICIGEIPEQITNQYNGDFNELKNSINTLITTTNEVSEQIKQIANGNLNSTLVPRSEQDDLVISLNTTISTLKTLISDVNKISINALDGNLNYRANSNKHNGGYAEIILGFNKTLDSVVKIINSASNIMISNKDGNITFMNDNVNQLLSKSELEIKNSLPDFDINNLIGYNIDRFYANPSSQKEILSNLKSRHQTQIELGNFVFNLYITPINDINNNRVGYVVEWVEHTSEAKFHRALNEISLNLTNGNLNHRIDIDNQIGEFIDISNNINKMIDSIIKPISLMIDYIKILSVGEIPAIITETYLGDFSEIKMSLNNLINNTIQIIEITNRLAIGDFTSNLDLRSNEDELIKSINQMINSIRHLIVQVMENVQTTSSTAEDLAMNAETMSAAAQEQSTQTEEIASAVEQMTRTITDNSQSTSLTSDVAKENGRIAVNGGIVVKETIGKMKDIAKIVRNSADNIQKLGDSSKEINEIVSVIDDIADQTNLLALNAAIEAARAGEQGRGFAVVADEVRKLAERTTEATQQIADMIKNILNETENVVFEMNKGNNEVQKGIILADKAGDSLNEIVKSSKEVFDMISQIAAANEEQSATSEEISRNILVMSQVISESANQITSIAEYAEVLTNHTKNLNKIMSNFQISKTITSMNENNSIVVY